MDLITLNVRADEGWAGVREVLHVSTLINEMRRASGPELSLNQAELFRIAAGAPWRRQVYGAVIVQTYAVHERFVRELASEVVDYFHSSFDAYRDTPERLRREHLRLSVRRLQDITERGHVAEGLDAQRILDQLSVCLAGGVQLNSEVLTRHPSNYRTSTVEEIFGRFGLDTSARASLTVASGATVEGVLNGIYASLPDVLDDLAERRNEVAHGAVVSEIYSIDVLEGIITAVQKFDAWLMGRVAQLLLDDLVARQARFVGEVDRVWSDSSTGIRSVARLVDVEVPVSRGDVLYVLSGGGTVRPCSVTSIQVNREPVDAARTGKGPFGMNLGVPVMRGNRISVLERKWWRLARVLGEHVN